MRLFHSSRRRRTSRAREQETRRRALIAVALVGANLLLAASIAFAAPGDLDPTFGVGGKVTTNFANTGISHDDAFALVRQPDGKLVVAGRSTVFSGGNADFALARYNPNGTLDSTFGTGGKVVTDFAGATDEARALVIQPDGKLVAAGYATVGAVTDFALARYNSNGTLDPTFGTAGKVTTHFASGGSSASAIVLRPNGKLLVAGSSGPPTNARFTVVRYKANGSLDASYGTGGAAITDVVPGFEHIYALVHVGSGKVVAAGVVTGIGGADFALTRYTAAGVLDATFGIGGKVITDFAGGSDSAAALVLRPDGKLIAGGRAGAGDFALARYTAAGVLDPTFGTAGKVTTNFSGFDQVYALVLRGGKILAGGTTSDGFYGDWALARYTAGGALDATFGTGGKVTTSIGDVGAGGVNSARALVLSGGKLLAAGVAYMNFTPSGGMGDFGLARYLL